MGRWDYMPQTSDKSLDYISNYEIGDFPLKLDDWADEFITFIALFSSAYSDECLEYCQKYYSGREFLEKAMYIRTWYKMRNSVDTLLLKASIDAHYLKSVLENYSFLGPNTTKEFLEFLDGLEPYLSVEKDNEDYNKPKRIREESDD